MLAERAELIAELRLDDKMSAGLSKAGRNLDKLGAKAGRAGKAIGVGLAAVGAAAAVGIAAAVRSGIESLQELENANTATASALEASGLAASVSADEIRKWSDEIEDASDAFIDDKEIQRAANTLIRLGGLSRDSLKEAMQVATDLGVVMGTDTESAAKQLAKALKDPLRGMTALGRAGVRLTKVQEDEIKALVKAGKAQEAQGLLLDYVAQATTGAAKAAGGPYTDALNKMRDAQEKATQALAVGFLPVITEVANVITDELSKPGTLAAIEDFGKGLAGALREGVKWARQLPWDQIVGGLKAAAGFAKTLIDAFTSLPPQAQAAIIALAGLNKLSGGAVTGIVGELGKGLIRGVLGLTAGVVNINAAKVFGGGGLGGGAKGGVPAAATTAAAGIGGATLASVAAIAAGVALPFVMFNVLPELFKGKPGSSGPTLATNTNPAQATTAVLNSVTQSMVKNYNATIGVGQKVSDARSDIRNGFTVQTSAIKNGFTTQTAGASKTSEIIRNGFNVQQTKLSDVARVTAAGDERTTSRLASMNSALGSKLGTVAGAVNTTTSVLRAKNFSPRITVPVSVSTSVSVRAVSQQQVTVARYTGGTSTGFTIR